jgi:hypothetical protein
MLRTRIVTGRSVSRKRGGSRCLGALRVRAPGSLGRWHTVSRTFDRGSISPSTEQSDPNPVAHRNQLDSPWRAGTPLDYLVVVLLIE